MRYGAVLLAVTILFASMGCRHSAVPVGPTAPNGSEYLDLAAGTSLSINVPLLKSGGYVASMEFVGESGTTLTISLPDLIGFRVSQYSVQGKADGRVRLKFTSATNTSDGESISEKKATPLPFDLPPNGRHIRLIYSVRSSIADHNMAITAARDVAELNAFTTRLRADPKVCRQSGAVFCVWVPGGIAVRPE